MGIKKSVVKLWIANNKAIGRSDEDIENDFKDMLKAKFIGVDDYNYAMEIIYGEN